MAVWDLLTATRVPDAPAEPFAAAVERDVDRCRLPAWCSVNTQLGTLTVQLHPSTAFKCEAFLDERDAESPDVNFGQAVVQALLREVQEQTMVAQRLDAHPGDTTPHAELQELYRQQNLKQGKSHDLFSIPEHTPFYFTIPADGGAPLTSEVFKPVSAHHRYHHHHSFVGILLHMHRAIWLTVVAVAATAVVASCQRAPPPFLLLLLRVPVVHHCACPRCNRIPAVSCSHVSGPRQRLPARLGQGLSLQHGMGNAWR